MKEEVHAQDCGREADLIAFLYGELDQVEKTAFRGHIQECLSCSAELTEFSNIRESVVAWRNEALVGFTSPAAQAPAIVRGDRSPTSALAAVREFFSLSPLWLKGAVVFGSLLFCLLAVLAAAGLRDTAPPAVAADPGVRNYSPQELNALVERRVQEELQLIRKSSPEAPTPPIMVKVSPNETSRRGANRSHEVAVSGSREKARRPLSKVERQQLAADLRLIDDPNDSGLYLLDDRINE